MRLQIMSDLHIDVTPGFEPRLAAGADAVVVAGDICEGIARGLTFLRACIPRPTPIIYVPGNHEYYHRLRSRERKEGAEAARTEDIVMLDDATAFQGRVRFVGSTLWSDYAIFGSDRAPASMQIAARLLPDHRLILEQATPPVAFSPEDARAQHLRSRAFLEQALSEPHSGPTVVVTHHAVHRRSIAPQFAADRLTPAFVSDLSGIMAAHRPALWVHGHTHVSFDYTAGPTRIVCNPLGYGDENPAFKPSLTVEV